MPDSIHIISSRQVGGAELFCARLINALAEAGLGRVTAVHPRNSAVCGKISNRVPHLHLPMRSVIDLWSLWSIRRAANRAQPAIVQSYLGRATRLTHLSRRSHLVHIARLGGFYNLSGFRHADAWVGISLPICDRLIRNGFPSQRVFHIGNFVAGTPVPSAAETAALRAHWRIPAEAAVIAAVGRLHPIKGFDDLLHAMRLLRDTQPARPLRLFFVGDGPMRQDLHALSARLKLDDIVIWTGWDPAPERYLALADLAVCPSRQEGLGNVILEAWAAQRPIIATRSAGAEYLIRHGETGWLTPLSDPAALAQAMRELLNNEALGRALVDGGAWSLRTYHSRESVVTAYADLYRSALYWPR